MTYWWDGRTEERYWCEITDRTDVGADLKCPQTDEQGKPYWSYGLIHAVWPGDIVFHYATPRKAFVGASVAGGPVEERPIVWTPHGTVGRSKKTERVPRPGWWRPLYGFRTLQPALSLASLNSAEHQAWIRAWLSAKQDEYGTLAAPLQAYPGSLRGAQGYLTKMPAEFVDRWPSLGSAVNSLAARQEELTPLGEWYPGTADADRRPTLGPFKPKSGDEYVAVIRAAIQRRSRRHEDLVRKAAERLTRAGAKVSNPHPIDLLITAPRVVLLEAKLVGRLHPGFAIRAAVGQLLEYRHFLGPREAELGILLDGDPGPTLVDYVEKTLGFLTMWTTEDGLAGGPRTVECLRLGLDR